MAKDYAKFIPPKKRPQPSSRGTAYYFVFLLALIALAGGGGYFLLAKQAGSAEAEQGHSVVARFLAAIAHKKLAPNPVKLAIKKAAPILPVESEVQFDFYSELPNMQVTLSEPATVAKGLTQIKTTPIVAAVKANPVDPLSTAAAKQPNLFNTEQLTTLLEAENQGAQYVIQLGVFESEMAANRLLEAITAVGFTGSVVKSPTGYRVQQGPYQSKELAKLTQQRLQKRGIISIIRKIA